MTSDLENQVSAYQQWRDELRDCIQAYQNWLEDHGHADIQRSLRIYDLVESLRNDRMILAFLAEFSRGKTELINAMFFSDFKQRLLPSDVGRTTMCPTEIFYDASEEPYIKLLPIESRKSDESIAALKHKPVEWVKIKLNLASQEEMATAMSSLAQVKSVAVEEAGALGLLDETDFVTTTVVVKYGGKVEIPCWRHALVNYPHPLLKKGLVILDTPGLNALGTEPELTLSMIPSAHAVLFLLAMDTGVTKSDLDVWQKYVQSYVTRRIAVLNKIDLMWDDLKSDEQIEIGVERQLVETARILGLPRDHVIALSAQKGLIARIRGDVSLLAKSRIEVLERLLAEEIIPSKQQILRAAVSREIGNMLETSLQSTTAQLASTRGELQEMSKLSGKNRDLAKLLLARLEQDKAGYLRHMESFKRSYATVLKQGNVLIGTLADDRLDEMMSRSLEAIEGSWTTAGLMRSMQALFDTFSRQAEKILNFSGETRNYVDGVYTEFHKMYGFPKMTPPVLNLERHILRMHSLHQSTERFCKDPVNVMTEKHFLVRRFYGGLVAHARELFSHLRLELDAWVNSALMPLSLQLKEHQKLLERKVENLRKVVGDINTLQERVRQLEQQQLQLGKQVEELTQIRDVLQRDPAEMKVAKVA
ncbi:MAG: dynamin family protein [Betaproteobacteria bacterium]|nr:dynamin family protein [Betaproteobacteria bacterium]